MDVKQIAALTEEQLKQCPPIAIPETLQKPEFRFVKLKPFEKKAFEIGWTKAANYSYNSGSLLSWIAKGGNYGVSTGIGGLLVVDIDNVERMKELGILSRMPETYTVRTRSGGLHFYYICNDYDKKRIMYDLVKTETYVSGKKEVQGFMHLGEMQWMGQQVVGPSSRYREIEPPDTVKIQLWKEENVLPIREVTAVEILAIFEGKVRYDKKVNTPAKDCLGKEEKIKPAKAKGEKHQAIDHSWQDKIPVAEIAIPLPLPDGSLKDNRETTGELAGDNPFHGSTNHTGNFAVNIKKNIWHCFSCNSGGGPLQLLAVSMGILDCSEAKPGCLTGDDYKTVLAELRKRGYKVPELTGNPSDKRKDLIFLMEEAFLANNQVATNQMGDLFVWDDGYKSMPDFVAMNMLQGYGTAYAPHVDPTAIATSLQSLKIRTVDRRPIDQYVLYCGNGVLYLDELRGGKLRFEPYAVGELPPLSAIAAAYDPLATCDFFIEHLQQSTEDPDKDIEVIQEFFGYCLFKEQRYAKSMVFVGPGRDGKTVVVNTLIKLIGSSLVCSVKPQEMTGRFNFSDMYLKMLNSVGELPSARITDSTGFKAATGNDYVKIEAKYGRPFTAKLTLKSIFMGNKIMPSDDASDAYYDRFIFIIFPNQFGIGGDSPKRDSLREAKLTTPAMLSGILNWALAGLERLIKNDEFSHQGDLEDRIRLHDSFTAPIGMIEETVSRFLIERPSSKVNLNDFKEILEELCYMRGESMPSSQNGYTRAFRDANIKLIRLKGLKSEGKRETYDYWIVGKEFSPQKDVIFKQMVGKSRDKVRRMMFIEECNFDIWISSAIWDGGRGQLPIEILN